VSSGGYTDTVLSNLIVEVFSTTYKSSKFIPGEEPLLSTNIYCFSWADLPSNYYTLKAAHYTYAKQVNKTAKEAFKEYLLPLELVYLYYIQGPLKPVNPTLYRFSSFKTRCD
jgi:hypothetical protein